MALPPNLSGVHALFPISTLRKNTPDPTHVVDWGELVVDVDGTFKEGSIRIIDSRDQVFQGKTVRLVKVLWQHRGVEKAIWEREHTIYVPIILSYLRANVFFLVI